MKIRKQLIWTLGLAGCLMGLERAGAAEGDPAKDESKAAAAESPATHTIKPGQLSLTAELSGIVESVEMGPVRLEPEVWADLSVVEVVPHGKRVTKGEVLLRVDTEKLEKQIEELEQQAPLSAITLELAEAELENLELTTPLKLEEARRTHRVTAEDYDYFEKVGRDQREKSTRFNLKSAEQRLEGAQEELDQLQKMYEADDLTEETEEIVLKRQKFAVEAAQFSLEATRLGAEYTFNTGLPREREGLLAAKRSQDYALQLAEVNLPKALPKKRLEVAKAKMDNRTTAEKLGDLKQDLKGLRVRAPFDGIVYYGDCDLGKWATGAAVAKKLVPGGKLAPREILMTVVNPDRLQLRAVVPENELYKLKAGLSGRATPISAPGRELEVRIDRIHEVPLLTGGFDAVISLVPEADLRLLPGMNCKLSFTQTGDPDRLLAPKEAVFKDNGQSYVYLAPKEGKPEKRTVRTGAASDKMIEVLEGLKEGDAILLKKPE